MLTKGKGIIFLKGNLYIYHLHVEADHLGRWLCVITVLSFPSVLGPRFFSFFGVGGRGLVFCEKRNIGCWFSFDRFWEFKRLGLLFTVKHSAKALM